MATFYTSNLVQVLNIDTTVVPTFSGYDLYTIPSGHYAKLIWFYAGRDGNFVTTGSTSYYGRIKAKNRSSPLQYVILTLDALIGVQAPDYSSHKKAFAATRPITLQPGEILSLIGTTEVVRYQLILELYKEF